MRYRLTFPGICLLFTLFPSSASIAQDTTPTTTSWAISQFGTPLYQDGIDHLPYVNPDAPKGGKIVLADFGSFDTLNFYVLKGDWPGSIGLVYDSLMEGSGDEIDGLYGVIAESIEYPEDASWAIFTIRPEARYHDGQPIRAEDFVFVLETIKKYGRPFIQSFYADVEGAEALDERRVKFTFATRHNKKPLTIVAGMYPLPVHYWQGKDITESTLTPPLSSGPYRIKDVDPGRSITYERVTDYWGANLPLRIGTNNFDEIRYDYYRDPTVELEAFKAGEIDFRAEPVAKNWATAYDIEEIANGQMIKRELANNAPRGMSGYFYNLRRAKFQDIRVREALGLLYDFEAVQRTLLYGKYARNKTYFRLPGYSAEGAPSADERALLEPFAEQLPEGTLTAAFEPPKTDGSGRNRDQKRQALRLLKAAGWTLKDGKMVSEKTGELFSVELMTGYPESQRLALPFIENLRGIGIDASIRLVDPSQWRVRIQDADFDLWVGGYNFFPPPGTELRNFFGSASADTRGGNSSGIRNPVVDALIETIVAAKSLDELQTASRALDRVLLWNHYAIPTFYNDEIWIAYWNLFGYPERAPKFSTGFPETWWYDEALAAQNAPRR